MSFDPRFMPNHGFPEKVYDDEAPSVPPGTYKEALELFADAKRGMAFVADGFLEHADMPQLTPYRGAFLVKDPARFITRQEYITAAKKAADVALPLVVATAAAGKNWGLAAIGVTKNVFRTQLPKAAPLLAATKDLFQNKQAMTAMSFMPSTQSFGKTLHEIAFGKRIYPDSHYGFGMRRARFQLSASRKRNRKAPSHKTADLT